MGYRKRRKEGGWQSFKRERRILYEGTLERGRGFCSRGFG